MVAGLTKRVVAPTKSDGRATKPLAVVEAMPRQQAGRPTSVELERRKGRVMDVATELFVTHGYAATSLVDIAKGAGVATRTLYQHFGDKEAIFREVLFARDNGKVATPPQVNGECALFETLMQTGRYVNDVALRERSVQLMRLMISESNRFPDMMKKLANTTFSRFRSNVSTIFRRLAEQGLIPDGDHDLSAAIFVDLILGNTPIMMYTGWRPTEPGEQDLRCKVELFIVGRFGSAASAQTKPVPKRRVAVRSA